MTDIQTVRIDKYLWAIRIFKSRSQASEACRKGRILVNNITARPSRTLHGNELLTVRKPPVTYTFKIIRLIENRVAAKIAVDYFEDLTPENEKIKLEIRKTAFPGYRKKGTGRPTKKERRVMDKWTHGSDG